MVSGVFTGRKRTNCFLHNNVREKVQRNGTSQYEHGLEMSDEQCTCKKTKKSLPKNMLRINKISVNT